MNYKKKPPRKTSSKKPSLLFFLVDISSFHLFQLIGKHFCFVLWPKNENGDCKS